MSDIVAHIRSLSQKLQLITKKYDAMQTSALKIEKAHEDTIAVKKELETRIKELETQNLVLKSAISHLDVTDKKLMEHKINGYIKSIDKTIALLGE